MTSPAVQRFLDNQSPSLRRAALEQDREDPEKYREDLLEEMVACDQLDFLLAWSESSVACAELLPVFGQDADLLLLARDGRVHAWAHDEPRSTEVVADSLEALLDHATTVPVDPQPPG